MGSPYNSCDIDFVGTNIFQLPESGWQDKYAWSEEAENLILVKWNLENNEPGFNLIMVNVNSGFVKESPRLLGLPDSILVVGNVVTIKNLYTTGKNLRQANCVAISKKILSFYNRPHCH